MSIYKKIIIAFLATIIIATLSVCLYLYYLANVGHYYYLVPKASNGTQLVANEKRTWSTYTSIYLKYPDSKELHDTGVKFSNDVAHEFRGNEDKYAIEWVDSHTVIFTYKTGSLDAGNLIDDNKAEIRY